MKPDLRFSASQRLKSRKSIDALFQNGKRISVGDFRFIYQLRPAAGIQLGVGAPSKKFKRAVDRNRIKRLIREAYRLDQHQWKVAIEQNKNGLDLFVLFMGRGIPTLSECKAILELARDRIIYA